MKALLIKKCNHPYKWYNQYVGKHVPLLAVEDIEYKSRELTGYTNFVSKGDADVVEIDDVFLLYGEKTLDI